MYDSVETWLINSRAGARWFRETSCFFLRHPLRILWGLYVYTYGDKSGNYDLAGDPSVLLFPTVNTLTDAVNCND